MVISVTVIVTHSLVTLGYQPSGFPSLASSPEGLMTFGEGTSCLSLSSWPHQQIWLSPWHDSGFFHACDVKIPFSVLCIPAPGPLESPGVSVAPQPPLVSLKTIHLITSLSHSNNSYCEIYKRRSKWNAVISCSLSSSDESLCAINIEWNYSAIYPRTFYKYESFQTYSKVKRIWQRTSHPDPSSTFCYTLLPII